MFRRATACVIVLCLSAALARTFAATGQAQQQQQPPPPPPAQAPQPQPTFRARVDTISVDVIVLDKKGEPVTDLTEKDFEIREGNKVQTVDTFKFIDVEKAQDSRPTMHREILSLEDQRREAGRDDTRVLVIYLDDYHVRRGNGLRVKEQLAEFVRQLAPNDLVALMYPLTPVTAITFSRNHEGTAQAIMNFEGRKYDYTPRNAYEERYQMQPPEILERMRNDLTISSLEYLCSFLGALRDGRKTVLFVSEGLSGYLPPGVNVTGTSSVAGGTGLTGAAQPPRNQALEDRTAFFASTEILSQLRLVFAAAGRTNTSVYTLDPRGLATSEFDISDRVGYETDRRTLNESMDTLRTIAGETDGRAIVNRNEPMPELKQMVKDNSSYYLLGYNSTSGFRDGKFHEIEVKVNRKDVDVRARKGYWAYTAEEAERAAAPAKPELARDVLEAFDLLAMMTEPSRRRRANVWIGALPAADNLAEVVVAWEGIPMPGAGDGLEAVSHVAVTAIASTGDIVYTGKIPKTDILGRASGRITFKAPPGPLRLRVTAENARDTRLEADDLGFEVPDFASPEPFVSMPVVFKGRTTKELQTIKATEGAVPAVGRSFSRTERLLLQFGIFNGSSPAELSLRLLNRQGIAIATL
ncbi:MAG TPA: VWA domain-containing protein, partial [Vicinamibacterales bacterium]|nr:VWA domain-containing protein [Vicinamibacterales bacterium]